MKNEKDYIKLTLYDSGLISEVTMHRKHLHAGVYISAGGSCSLGRQLQHHSDESSMESPIHL